MHNRPCIRSYDAANHQISYMAIPTLEDLKQTLFPAGDLIIELGYPFKVTTKGDIETGSISGGVSSWGSWSLQYDNSYNIFGNQDGDKADP